MEGSTAPATEVSYDQALAEEAGVDQVKARPRPGSEKPQEDIIDILAPKIKPKVWHFGKDDEGNPIKQYTQRELSVITKAQWFELVGEYMEKTLGEVKFSSLISPPDSVRQAIAAGGDPDFRPTDFDDADTFVAAITKLLSKFPDFLQKSVCIWLEVPDYEWDVAIMLMKQSPELGGLSDAMLFEMIEIFIDQNYKEVRSNFRERFQSLRARWRARTEEADRSS